MYRRDRCGCPDWRWIRGGWRSFWARQELGGVRLAHRCNGCGIFGLSRRVGHEEDIWRMLRECGKDGSQTLGRAGGGGWLERGGMNLGIFRPGVALESGLVWDKKNDGMRKSWQGKDLGLGWAGFGYERARVTRGTKRCGSTRRLTRNLRVVDLLR